MESRLADNIDNNLIAQNVGNNQLFLPKNQGILHSGPQQLVSNVGTNQIFLPKNSVPSQLNSGIPNVINNSPQIQGIEITPNTYYKLFGFEISKSTMYIAIVFILLVSIYYYYTKNNTKISESKENDKKKKKKKDKKNKDEDKSSTSEESN